MAVWFEESYYSYWSIVFNDGLVGMLAEGYGLYAILIEENNPVLQNSKLANPSTGQVLINTDYQFQKKNTCLNWEVEGELLLQHWSTRFEVKEYSSKSGDFFSVFEWNDRSTNIYRSNPTSYDDLKLANTTAKNPYGKRVKCTQCSTEIVIDTYPLAHSCTCNECGSFFSFENNKLINKGNNKNNAFTTIIPIGATGNIKDIDYRVVGYTKKQEQNAYKAKWKEYVLFNPIYGFAFLSEYDGHWIYVKETSAAPVILNENTKDFEFNKESFYLYNSYSYSLVEARGEFPYNAFDNRNTMVKEYISPPEIWIREKDSKEGIVWFLGEHINGSTIQKAFSVKSTMPYKRGIGAVQPTGYISILKLITMSTIGILGLLLVFMMLLNSKKNQVILQGTYNFSDSSVKVRVVTEKFQLSKWRSNMKFDISAPVSNSWFQLSATLVNVETGKEYSLEQGVEYYYGYSDGEGWTEGSTNETAYITNIPAGKYFLQMEGAREINAVAKLSSFSTKVVYDAPSYRNLWIAIIMLLLWPTFNYIRNRYTEKSRWQDSPFSTYSDN